MSNQQRGIRLGLWSSLWDGGSFGRHWNKDNPNLVKFYNEIYFDFGLTGPRHLKENTKVPLVVQTGFDNKIYGFEVHGAALSPQRFMSSGWDTTFQKISRNIPIAKNRVWAYDITRLHEGILIGTTVYDSDAAYAHSGEYLKILHLIGGGIHKPLSKVPAINLEFGRTWEKFAVPDRISFALDSMYPFTDSDFLQTINLITHSYRNQNAPVSYSFSGNPATGTMEITAAEIVPQAPVSQPQAPQSAPESVPEPQVTTPDDGFPYDFYRGLGLIDEHDRVWLPSSVSDWMNIPYHMTEPEAKAHLLSYKPEG